MELYRINICILSVILAFIYLISAPYLYYFSWAIEDEIYADWRSQK